MKNRLKDLVDSALNGQTVFHLALMAGTGFAANSAILPKIVEFGIDPGASAMIAAVVGMAAAVAIDGGFKKQLPYAVSVLFGKKDRATGVERKKGFNLVVVILVMITGGTSLFFNWKVTPEITQTIIQNPDGATQTAMSATLAGKYDRDVERLEKAVQRAEQGVQRAEQKKDNAVSSAVAGLGSKMAQLVKSGNAWAIQQTNSAKRKAERSHARAIAKAESDLSSAQAALSAYIASAGKEVTTAQTSLVKSYELEQAEAKTAQNRWGSAFILFWIVSFIGFIGCTVVVVVYEDETGEDVTHNPTIFSVLWKLIIRTKDAALAFIIGKTGLEYAFEMPTLAGGAVLKPTPTPERRTPKNRKSEQSQKESQNTENKSESRSEKGRCKTEKCSTVAESQNRETQKKTESASSDRSDSEETEYASGRVEEWPAPHEPGWDNFRKSARGWWDYAQETDSETTRATNMEKWERVKQHCSAVGYIATVEKNKKGQMRPVIRKAAFGEPTVLVEDHEYEWTNGSI